ncbi:MAG: SPOR domain-containing protein [Erythrobacter sp.]
MVRYLQISSFRLNFGSLLKRCINLGGVLVCASAFATAFALAFAWAAAWAVPATAQSNETTSREIVQPLPSQEVAQLNDALLRLARRPRDLSALIDAGNAALVLDDLDAAMGFFGRAQELSPESARVKMGIAAVFLRSGRPIQALQLFNEAEAAGASSREVLADRGLAFDLVGNNVQAQDTYRAALRLNQQDETVRRLALSHAIAGERSDFESTLLPLLERRDFAAFRTQAFGLAILGDQDEAAAIADAVMPRDLAARVIPYLAFMPRLTKSQQAAAANLGIFPSAAEVGRDDPRIAQFADQGNAISEAADARLAPAGEPLGTPVARVAEPVVQNLPAPVEVTPSAVQIVQAEPQQVPPSVQEPVLLASVDRGIDTGVDIDADTSGASDSATAAEIPRPGFDLSRVNPTDVPAASAPSVTPAPAPQEPAPSVADAFANFSFGDGAASDSAANGGVGAVDLSEIEIPRESAAAVEPQEPDHPSRHWVQIATGRDRSALRFDWRRFARTAPELLGEFEPHVVAWGQANRLLAGPVSNAREARDLMNALAAEGVDGFTYTSPEGQEIQELN